MFKKFAKSFNDLLGLFLVAVIAAGVLATSDNGGESIAYANATLFGASVDVDVAPVFVLAGIIITAIAAIWAIKKVIALGNKS